MNKGSRQNSTVFDRSSLLERIMDDEVILKKVIALALEDIPKQFARLKNVVHKKDSEQVQSFAHLIKGAAANIGAEPLRIVANELEKNGKSGNITRCEDLVVEMGQEVARLIDVLRDELSNR